LRTFIKIKTISYRENRVIPAVAALCDKIEETEEFTSIFPAPGNLLKVIKLLSANQLIYEIGTLKDNIDG
jgi:hypothetical protein